jgi:hypothetical protein
MAFVASVGAFAWASNVDRAAPAFAQLRDYRLLKWGQNLIAAVRLYCDCQSGGVAIRSSSALPVNQLLGQVENESSTTRQT